MSHPEAAPRSVAEQSRLEAALRDLFEHKIRFNELLGLSVDSLSAAGPRIRFDMRPELIGHYSYGRLHGGVTSAVLDAMGGLALMVAIGDKHRDETADQVLHRFGRIGTIDLRVDYLRPGMGHRFTASAHVTRMGGRIASTQMALENETGALIATAAAAYVVS